MPTAKVGTQWFAVDADDKPTGEPTDIELAYETYGDAGAAPLLMCNGVSMQGVLFGPEFLEALAAAGPYFVIAYDSRDCGLSTKIDAAGDPAIAQVFAQKQLGMRQQRKDGIPYFISDLAADAVGLLDALGVSAAHVVSFSTLGGATAQKMVIEHTARVSSLTMISGGTAEFGMPPPDPEAQKALEAVGESAAEADPVATFVAAARVLMSESNFDEERVTAVAKLANERAPPADGTAQGQLMRRQLCSQIAEEPRIKALQQAVPTMAKNAAACARGQLTATLTTTEQITPPEVTAKKFTAFVCEVRCGDELVNTLKDRYSSFLDLRDRLEANTIWSEQVKALEFPPKSVFGSFESTIIKNRIEGITKWFAQVLAVPGLKDCYELCSFLGVPCGEASPVVIVHGAKDGLMAVENGQSCAKGCVGADLVVVEDMGHEICSFGPSLYEPIFGAIATAAGRSGNPATGSGGLGAVDASVEAPAPAPSPKTRSV